MTLSKTTLSLIGAAFLLVGCTNDQPELKPIATEPDIVSVKLAQAADKAAKSLDTIAGIEQQKNPDAAPLPDNYAGAPSNLMQPVSLRWSGPIEQVARTLAEHAGMRFRVKGNLPPVPLTVNVDAYQQPILHILRDIGLQAGSRADLNVDANEGVVEIRYAADDRSR